MRRFIVSTQIALGMYDEALSTYNEIERRLGADTINNNYTAILRSRAIVARAKGRITEAYDYQTRDQRDGFCFNLQIKEKKIEHINNYCSFCVWTVSSMSCFI